MRLITFLFIIVLSFGSCATLKETDTKALSEYNTIKSFDVDDFDVYVFNICENYGSAVNPAERFCECPDDFFDVAQMKEMRKVEELYMLIHKTTDLVLYFTTTSHKYIYKRPDGFLNDPKKFKNTIVLNEIEHVYVGRKDLTAGYLHFPSFKDVNDIILHYDKQEYPEAVFLVSGNLATAENDYDISEEIPLQGIFNQSLVYKRHHSMTLKYYQPSTDTALALKTINLASKSGKVKLLLGFDTVGTHLFEPRKMKIKYHPNYSLIRE